jgi:hypothetical protein
LIAAETGQVMADQDPPSPTPNAVIQYYGLAVLLIKESHSGRYWDTGNALCGAIFYLNHPTTVEVNE